jgi:hypothetical protein
MDVCMQYYIHYLDIVSLTRFDTSLCNKKLRSFLVEECKKYINFEIYTTSEYYQYVYLRQIKNKNIIIFNNRQLKLFYDNLIVNANANANANCFIAYLSISDCCIDNNLINYILNNFSKLRVLNIGTSKFTNPMLDEKNIVKYELINIYSTLFLDDKFVYKYCHENMFLYEMSDYIYIFNNTHFLPIYLDTIDNNSFPLKCDHGVYLIDSIQLIEDSIKSTEDLIEPIKYMIPYENPIKNIMNNICGNLEISIFDDSVCNTINLEELYICGTNNLKYKNIIPILRVSNKLKLLKLHIATTEDILEILQYDISIIELINEKLKFQTVIDAIHILDKKIVKLEINIKEIKTGVKINFGFTTNDYKTIFITFWAPRLCKIDLCKILRYCYNIDELKVNTVYIFMITRRENIHFSNLKKIKILNSATIYKSTDESVYDELTGEDIFSLV